ncbi:POT family MFS transporter [Lacipirellula parvula]|uniref:Di-tripeptide/cation symporter n=1 Tax=Lacipirellula parvula TaxID=2650471 RepID=A0A5K7XDN9_9BACT|nr:POT family MFS transporter [Lacipirellula parvula]BBO34880.1 di-tripeptide/cation symporter [Lacipirellula parvula]
MSNSAYRTTPQQIETMPPGIGYIIGNEVAERFSFYGMRAILYVFMTEHLMSAAGSPAVMDKETATEWQHWFMVGVYALPLFGAILSDWLLGKYRTIITLSLAYCLGHAVLALVDFPQVTGAEPKTLLLIALCLLSLGAGGIKPCVSAHVGDQFGSQNKQLLPRIFQWFYFSINLGAAGSMILTPRLLANFGPGVAFGVPGVLMAIATFVFWLGRHEFVHIPATGNRLFTEIISPDSRRAIFNLMPVFVFTMMFFCLFDQTQSRWVEQAKSMNRNVMGFDFNPSEFQAVNSIFVLILVPIFGTIIYPTCERFFAVTPLRKIGAGLFVTAISFAICALVQKWIDGGGHPHIAWQVLAYIVITAGEVLVSITVLELSYTQAPQKIKSFMMGVFMLVAIAGGNVLTAVVNGKIKAFEAAGYRFLTGENYYWTFTIAMVATAVVFVAWSQFYRGQTYIQGEEASTH